MHVSCYVVRECSREKEKERERERERMVRGGGGYLSKKGMGIRVWVDVCEGA